ncbi:MAG: P-loop NTPase fold protein [Streptococcus sp.]|nr:P-loop NTPase fold protein [Streptococcus sp.]
MTSKVIAISDTPTSEDKLGIEVYTKGLAEFILNCETPLTIAIQGDWGSGKSSIMSQAGKYIKDTNVKILNFNTWQYSQFNMDQFLAVSLITDLLTELNVIANKNSKLKNIFKNSKNAITGILECADLSSFFLDTDKLVALINRNKNIAELKSIFENAIQESLEKTETDRVVIFIDDLDRLAPKKAVELMEILKLFLDCVGCVFVLAIDYDVVVSGVREKYANVGEGKEKVFFDKLIQVPFSVPVEKYTTAGYIEHLLLKISNKESDNSENTKNTKEIEELVLSTIGKNPRTINRLINVYSLNNIIFRLKNEKSESDNSNFNLPLFILSCWQLSFEKEYFRETSSQNKLRKFLNNVKESKWESSEDDSETFENFVAVLRGYLSREDSLTEELIAAYEFTKITSVNTQTENSQRELGISQEKFWEDFVGRNEVIELEALKDYTLGKIGQRNFIYFNGKNSSKIFELYLNKSSLRVLCGTYHKKSGSKKFEKQIQGNREKIKEELNKKYKDSESKYVDNTNYTGYILKSTDYGLDISTPEEITNWFVEAIDNLHSVMQEYFKK